LGRIIKIGFSVSRDPELALQGEQGSVGQLFNCLGLLCDLAGVKPKQDVENGDEKPWVLKDLRKTCGTYYDEHMPESSIEILGHSVGEVTYRHYAGGHPTWVQDAAYPKCLECGQTMMFLAQVDRHDIEEYSEGTYFSFVCLDCMATATVYQQS
jgi:hypothetical protein